MDRATSVLPSVSYRSLFGREGRAENIILQMKESVNCLSDSGNDITVHWVPGHRDIEGNELADCQAKEAANEMVGADTEDFPVKRKLWLK